MAIDRWSNACGMGAPTRTSIVAPPRHRRRIRWRTKHYLSVAMLGTLVVIALVAAIFISLAPARLTFSITNADVVIAWRLVPEPDRSAHHSRKSTHLNFILQVYNSSPRTAVLYGPISGEVSYGPAATAWVRCSHRSVEWQKPNSTINFNFSADYGYDNTTRDALDSCRILMESKVRFSWHGMLTLPYTVRFSCEAVDFQNKTNFPITCA